jgi:hypothetical protein
MGELKLRQAIREELQVLQQIEYVPEGKKMPLLKRLPGR